MKEGVSTKRPHRQSHKELEKQLVEGMPHEGYDEYPKETT